MPKEANILQDNLDTFEKMWFDFETFHIVVHTEALLSEEDLINPRVALIWLNEFLQITKLRNFLFW